MSLLPLGILSSSGGAAPAAFELISTTVLGSAASSVTFSSIASTYKHLQIRFALTTSAAGYAGKMQFNSDTGANYNAHSLLGTGSSVVSQGVWSDIYTHTLNSGTGGSSETTAGIIDILDYANTNKYKTARILSGLAGSSAKEISLFSGAWRSNSAITTVTLAVVGATTYAAGSRFSLYGVKGV